jgi:hypothetical protein
MIFTDDLEKSAYRSGNEYAWRRTHALAAVEQLLAADLAVLGGEVWLVLGHDLLAAIPQRAGAPSVEHWTCDRDAGESWRAYVLRSAAEARVAIHQIPDLSSAEIPAGYTVHYNMSWESEAQSASDIV